MNQPAFGPGQTLLVSLAVTSPGLPLAVDFFLGILGETLALITDGGAGLALARVSDLRTLRPVAAGVSLATPFAVTAPNFLAHIWTGGEPPGPYVLFLAVTRAGALADGVVGPADLLALVAAPFSFAP